MLTDLHIHQWVYYRVRNDGIILYRCNDPNCYAIKDKALLIGKETVCSKCKVNRFILTPEDLRRKVPRCPDCSNTKASLVASRAKNLLNNLMPPAQSQLQQVEVKPENFENIFKEEEN